MTTNTTNGQIDRDTESGSIEYQRVEKRFTSLKNSNCRDILNLASGKGWTTDQEIQNQLDITDKQLRDCFTQLINDGFVEQVGTIERQFTRITHRGKWATKIRSDDIAGVVEEGEP